jgi:hypothetical protein
MNDIYCMYEMEPQKDILLLNLMHEMSQKTYLREDEMLFWGDLLWKEMRDSIMLHFIKEGIFVW